MNRKQFLEQPDVLGLIDWLIENLPTLPVHLKVARSRFVRKAIDCKVQGIGRNTSGAGTGRRSRRSCAGCVFACAWRFAPAMSSPRMEPAKRS
ncbi:hypothetical protein AL048_17915 [Pseudomonas syringae pv. castaneae]|nr:hypothetical protein AL048_17915 [Pseudomonas syringae pv. castaneae]